VDRGRDLYAAAAVGASIAYVFNVLAFTGTFDVFRWVVFVGMFLGFTYGFERFIDWQVDSA